MTPFLATTTPTMYWYVTRGTGAVALVLLTLGLVLGVVGPTGLRTHRWPRFVVAGLHRNVTLLAVVFVALHVVTTIVDGFAPIGFRDALIPFLSPYRPLWLGLGTVAFDLLLALVVTSIVRRRVGYRIWWVVHWLAYLTWPVAMLHSLGTGTDARLGWMTVLAAVCASAVVAAVLFRVAGSTVRPGGRLTAVAATLLVAVTGTVWYRTGPLQHGWARRAGTPAALLGGAAPRAATQPVSLAAPQELPAPPYSAPLAGRFAEAGPDHNGLESVAVSVVTRGVLRSRLRLDLWGLPLDGGGVEMRASQVRFGPPAAPSQYTGRIVGLDGSHVLVSLRDAAGRPLSLDLRLQIDHVTGHVGGSLSSLPAGGSGGTEG
jgi:sulfoxide reductase heme-binding subunit YedZ